jgi:chromosome partitioning protein
MRSIAIINQKGGCGKTTISINLAATFAKQGHRTLLVDMDPQSHCAVGLAVPEEQIEKNIYDVLISPYSDTKTSLVQIAWQISQNFYLAPSGIELAALDSQLIGHDNRQLTLSNMLAQVQDKYDIVIIDCPPSVNILSFNALFAATEVIIPVETGYFALHGLTKELETLEALRHEADKNISFKVIASMYDVRTKLAREINNELKKKYGNRLFKTAINFNTKLKEAASYGQPITEYAPSCKGMSDFKSLVEEILSSSYAPQVKIETIAAVNTTLAKISKSADELVAQSNALIGAPSEITVPETNIEQRLNQKIDIFYGIRQQNGKVEFSVLYPKATNVCIAGDFNNWQPENTHLSQNGQTGRWTTSIEITGGTYKYRYVVDGQWQQDPYNNRVEQNPFGEMNSVLEMI